MVMQRNDGIMMPLNFFEGIDPHNPWIKSNPESLEEESLSSERNSTESTVE